MIRLRVKSVAHGAFCAGLVAWVILWSSVPAWADLPIEQEPVNYSSTPAIDPVARLQERIDRGDVKLRFDDEGQGYLKSILQWLKVAPESQTLVFSKTSFQHARISPRTPRALYFGDDVYVGWVKGGEMLEFAAVDPKLGTTFYLLDQQMVDKPTFLRQTDSCLQCHQSSKTQDVPGLIVRSVYPDRRGFPVFSAGTFVTDHTSPLSERWGGWYVTGKLGGQRHMGNGVVNDRNDRHVQLDVVPGCDRTDLDGLVGTSPYLTGHSDVVALMVLEHQTQTQNLITLASYQGQIGQYYDAGINKALGQPAQTISEGTVRRINHYADKLVDAFLFCGETRLEAPIEGTSGFTAQFASRGPFDHKGRSLRDFDLHTRLFKYPCSYLIDSESFEALPVPMKARVYNRLREILTGRDTDSRYAHLSSEDRKAILEILAETKDGMRGR